MNDPSCELEEVYWLILWSLDFGIFETSRQIYDVENLAPCIFHWSVMIRDLIQKMVSFAKALIISFRHILARRLWWFAIVPFHLLSLMTLTYGDKICLLLCWEIGCRFCILSQDSLPIVPMMIHDRLTVVLQFGMTLLYCFSLILICSYKVLWIRDRF